MKFFRRNVISFHFFDHPKLQLIRLMLNSYDSSAYDLHPQLNRHLSIVTHNIVFRNGMAVVIRKLAERKRQNNVASDEPGRRRTEKGMSYAKKWIMLGQAMPCGTLSANRTIFSREKIVRFLLVGENPNSPITHRWCSCASCGRFHFVIIVPANFPFWLLPVQLQESTAPNTASCWLTGRSIATWMFPTGRKSIRTSAECPMTLWRNSLVSIPIVKNV